MRFAEALIQKRLCTEHTIIRERTAAEQDGVSSDKTIVTDLHRSGCLPIAFEIDAVRENLRLEASERCELSDDDGIGAVDQVTMRDGGMLAENELRLTIRFLREMTARPKRETGDPIAATN